MNKKISLKKRFHLILELLARQWPNARCELVHNNGFQLLIAVVLSAQTTDKSVNKALAPLLEKKPQFSPGDLLELGEEEFLKVIRSIGLAPTKAKNCIQIAKILTERYGAQVPLKREDLESLPGVGRKTANVVLNVLAHEPTFAVDTHVERVSKRLGVVSQTENRLKIEQELLKIVPAKYGINAHHLLIFHGRYLCKAQKPNCPLCPVAAHCDKIGVESSILSRVK